MSPRKTERRDGRNCVPKVRVPSEYQGYTDDVEVSSVHVKFVLLLTVSHPFSHGWSPQSERKFVAVTYRWIIKKNIEKPVVNQGVVGIGVPSDSSNQEMGLSQGW